MNSKIQIIPEQVMKQRDLWLLEHNFRAKTRKKRDKKWANQAARNEMILKLQAELERRLET